MRQILEPHWQTNSTGGLQNLSALWKEKLLRVSGSSCFLRRPEDIESLLQTENGTKVGGPQAWEGLGSCLMTGSQGSGVASGGTQCGALKETEPLSLGSQPQQRFWHLHAWPEGSRATSPRGIEHGLDECASQH